MIIRPPKPEIRQITFDGSGRVFWDVVSILVAIAFVVAITLLFASTAWGDTYFVNGTAGNDDSSGLSLEGAWETIRHACETVVAGDTAWILPALYTSEWGTGTSYTRDGKMGPLHPLNSGASGSLIVYAGYDTTIAGLSEPVLHGNLQFDNVHGHAPILIDGGRHHILIRDLTCKWGYPGGVRITDGSDSLWFVNVTVCTTFAACDGNIGDVGTDNGGGFAIFYNRSDSGSGNSSNAFGIYIDSCEVFDVFDYCYGDNYICATNCSGIHIYGTQGIEVTNTTITGCGYGDGGNGIRSKDYDTSHVFMNNIISECGIGIYVGSAVRDIRVHHNKIFDCDRGIMVFSGDDPDYADSTMIYNNTIYACGAGIYFRTYISDLPKRARYSHVFNNLVVDCYGGSDDGVLFTPNYSVRDSTYMISPVIIDYNCYWNQSEFDLFAHGHTRYTLAEWQSATDWDDNTISQNPMFNDSASQDFGIPPESPCATSGRGGTWPAYQGAEAPESTGDEHDVYPAQLRRIRIQLQLGEIDEIFQYPFGFADLSNATLRRTYR